jgi:hypothetical protein
LKARSASSTRRVEPLRRARTHVRRELELERRVAALVLAELRPVEPGGGVPVGGADDQEDALPCQAEGTSIVRAYQPIFAVSGTPESLDPHGNGTVMASGKAASPFCQPGAVPRPRVEAELPCAVQVHPAGALEVGAGCSGSGMADCARAVTAMRTVAASAADTFPEALHGVVPSIPYLI